MTETIVLDDKVFIISDDASANIVSPGGATENHIKCVDIYSANDNYEPLHGAVRCFVDLKEKSLITHQIKNTIPHQVGRLRYEPAVRITLQEECGQKEWYLYISHHKGTVSLTAELVSSDVK
jgi:hypothetical protein